MATLWYRTRTVDGLVRGIGFMKMKMFDGWVMGMFTGMVMGNIFIAEPVSPFVRDM